MFDRSFPEIADVASLTDAGVGRCRRRVGARGERCGCARVGGDGGDLSRRTGLPAGQRGLWWVDPDAAVATELAAALHVSAGMALHQTHRGTALRDRLPTVAALFGGVISDLLVRTIVSRTYPVVATTRFRAVDTALGERVVRWGALW